MDLHFLRLALRTPFPTAVAVSADQLLLLRVDRGHRLAQALKRPHATGDAPELRIPIRMLAAFERLAVGLQAIAQFVQQPVHRALADPMAFSPQLLRQARRAAACPAQRSLRVAPGERVEQMLQRLDQTRVALRHRLATAARGTNPRTARPRSRRRGRIQFPHACPHRAARQPGRLGNPCNSAAANGAGFRRGPEASRAFVQQRPQHVELSLHRLRYGVHDAEHSRAAGVTDKLFLARVLTGSGGNGHESADWSRSTDVACGVRSRSPP